MKYIPTYNLYLFTKQDSPDGHRQMKQWAWCDIDRDTCPICKNPHCTDWDRSFCDLPKPNGTST